MGEPRGPSRWSLPGRRRRAERDLADLAETIGKLSHEVRNPLASIKGLASTGATHEGSLTQEEQAEFFRLIDAEATRLSRTIQQAATAMRIRAGVLRYQPEPVDLGELVREVAGRAALGEHPLELDAPDGIQVEVDRARLAEALENLIENAARFSPPDAPITLTVGTDGSRAAEILIGDRGPGIPPERRDEVTEPFATWRPPGYEETPGAGLGLFIAGSHVRAMGGHLALEEREDGGTMLRLGLG